MNTDQQMLDELQKETFDYFLYEVDKETGLIVDKTQPGTPSSIAVVGMGISCYIIGVKKGFLSRENAVERILRILRFFANSDQSGSIKASGYKGFYYHFLDMRSGKRAWTSELSTIDTALFIAGVLSAGAFFTEDHNDESEIRLLADKLYSRIDWQWALNGGDTLSHGWTPETGFIPFRWDRDYNESMIMYILATGSSTYPIGPKGYETWTSTFKLTKAYGLDYLYAGPLFIHQFSHLWIDFKGIRDKFNNDAGFDYFENSRRATLVHQQYAIENPKGFKNYGEHCWGQTASDGPGFQDLTLEGESRSFYGYIARGAPDGPDDGTVSPWGVVASLPFAPSIVIETTRHAIEKFNLRHNRLYGFDASFNPTYPERTGNVNGWVSPWKFGLNQGPIVIMIENYQTGMIWELMKKSQAITTGLHVIGFAGGWLDSQHSSPIH